MEEKEAKSTRIETKVQYTSRYNAGGRNRNAERKVSRNGEIKLNTEKQYPLDELFIQKRKEEQYELVKENELFNRESKWIN